jgi:hypothetical protein
VERMLGVRPIPKGVGDEAPQTFTEVVLLAVRDPPVNLSVKGL